MSSMTTSRSSPGMRAARERRSVLFPEPVAPAMRMFARAATASASSRAAPSEIAPAAVQDGARPASGRDIRRNLRMEIDGPPIGAITAFARLPSRIRASTKGRSSVSSRPTPAAIRCASSVISSDRSNRVSVRTSAPSRSMKTSSAALTSTSVTASSSRSGCRTPKPKMRAARSSSSPSVRSVRAA